MPCVYGLGLLVGVLVGFYVMVSGFIGMRDRKFTSRDMGAGE